MSEGRYIAEVRRKFVNLASRPNTRFSDIQEEFLTVLYKLDEYRKEGAIPEGEYRQKGNAFRDLILALIKSRVGFKLRDMRVEGFTDEHDLDLGFYLNGVLYVGGQVKMIGSPPHSLRGERKPERPTRADIDKRMKEVKYTPLDLKLKYSGTDLKNGQPGEIGSQIPSQDSFSFWACRIGAEDDLDLIASKFVRLTEYNNGVGVILYREEKGRYTAIEKPELKPLTIDNTIDQIGRFLLESVGRPSETEHPHRAKRPIAENTEKRWASARAQTNAPVSWPLSN